jgi:putative transposase
MSRQLIDHYNTVRLHSGIGYVTPLDKLLGRDKAILRARNEKRQQARERRRQKRAVKVA